MITSTIYRTFKDKSTNTIFAEHLYFDGFGFHNVAASAYRGNRLGDLVVGWVRWYCPTFAEPTTSVCHYFKRDAISDANSSRVTFTKKNQLKFFLVLICFLNLPTL